MRYKNILCCGGLGFIGSEFVRQLYYLGYKVTVLDKYTYAADYQRIKETGMKVYKEDICNTTKIKNIVDKRGIDVIINFSAESHVDNSIKNPKVFLDSNIYGVYSLLEVIKKIRIPLIHISTDECLGDIRIGSFDEEAKLNPKNPYSACKASGENLIQSYINTYGVQAIIIRPTNNYGIWQYPEKFIPVALAHLFKGKPIPVYGKGEQIRSWLHVYDCVQGILRIIKNGKMGEIYHLDSQEEYKNIDIARMLSSIVCDRPNMIEFVPDRPGHDFRYSLSAEKTKELGWEQKCFFNAKIQSIVKWYYDNRRWLFSKIKI